jgi:CRP-like cAMP-binding protein
MPNVASPTGNRLLDSLPPEDLKRLLPHLEPVSLGLRQPIHSANVPIEFVYFVTRGMISVVARLDDEATVEVGAFGSEGLVGVSVVLGVRATPHEAFVQAAGTALRMQAIALIEQLHGSRVLHDWLLRYAQTVLVYAAQTAACNARHTLEERLARWLLIAHDRIGTDELPLTQEFLAIMLAVRRTGVTIVAGTFQQAGMIRYKHGRITIIDRAAIEAAACECYRIVKDESARVLQIDDPGIGEAEAASHG